MKKIAWAIKQWFDRQKNGEELWLTDATVERICDLYMITYFRENDPFKNGNDDVSCIAKAMVQVFSQLPVKFDREKGLRPYLLKKCERVALRKMCNDYCLWLADGYDRMPFFMKSKAAVLYSDFTNIMLLFK